MQYTSGRLVNPDRIFFDLQDARLTPQVAHDNVSVDGELLTAVRVAQNHAGVVRIVLDVKGVKDYTASTSENPPQLLIDLYKKALPPGTARAAKSSVHEVVTTTDNLSDSSVSDSQTAAKKSVGMPLKNLKSATKSDLLSPATAPQPTHDGQSTLTRALGLKIGRIVIDAGHGGHDTGTIGPTGLMEKDLCLDVALRLGKIIQQRLPGADVVFTRSDDTFIPWKSEPPSPTSTR